jgi:hypothetical protein
MRTSVPNCIRKWGGCVRVLAVMRRNLIAWGGEAGLRVASGCCEQHIVVPRFFLLCYRRAAGVVSLAFKASTQANPKTQLTRLCVGAGVVDLES